MASATRNRWASRPILCAVLGGGAFGERRVPDAGGSAEESVRLAESLFRAGADWIQLRDRSLEAETLFRVASAIARAAEHASGSDARSAASGDARPRCRLIVNRRVDIAAALGAGAHLGFDALSADDASRVLGPGALLGASFHSAAEVQQQAGAQTALRYAHLAPIWDPVSKPATRPALGLGPLRAAAAAGLPLLAQGGLDPRRASQAIEAGAAGVAVTGQLTGAEDPAAAIRRFRAALDGALGGALSGVSE